MSQIPSILNITEEDVRLMLACGVHLGSENPSTSMIRYIWKRNDDGVNIIDIRKTWEKLQLAARVIVAMNNQSDVCAVALTTGQTKQQPLAQRAVLKFSQQIGCRHIAGRYTPGTFTNRIQSNFFEPRLLVVSDPVKDFQPILESSYVNMPVIAMADVDSPTRHIDIVIPCNTRSKYAVALVWWMLAREVLRFRGEITRDQPWQVPVDMFLFREPEETEKLEQRNYPEYVQTLWEGQQPGEDVEEGVEVTETGEFTEEVKGIEVNEVGEPGQTNRGWEDDEDETWGGN
jgi:small subunit ribosomal protein SAe